MRSGAVTNRTYRAWGKIKLPKYLFKLHLVCTTIVSLTRENRTFRRTKCLSRTDVNCRSDCFAWVFPHARDASRQYPIKQKTCNKHELEDIVNYGKADIQYLVPTIPSQFAPQETTSRKYRSRRPLLANWRSRRHHF